MPSDIRTRNLHLARHLSGGLGNLAKALAAETNETALIKMGQGEKEIPNSISRSIEEKLSLPSAWMDRDNELLIGMSPLDYALHQEMSALPEQTRRALLTFIVSLPKSK